MKSIDDEGPEVRFNVRLEKSRSIRDRIIDFLTWCDILLRVAVFMAIASVIIAVGLVHNGLDWFHLKAKATMDGFH